jgi:hypothetical protein
MPAFRSHQSRQSFLFSSVPKLKGLVPVGPSQNDGKIRSHARWQVHVLAFGLGKKRKTFSFSSPKL